MAEKGSTPILVAVIGALTLLYGVIALIAGTLVFTGSSLIDDLQISQTPSVIIVAAVVNLIIGWGLLKGWKIMWYLGIIIYAITIIVSLFDLPAGILSILVSLVIIFYLTRPKVRNHFLGD